MKLLLLILLTILRVFGQQDPPAQYSAGAFIGFNRYDTPQFKGGAFFDTRIADKTYSTSVLNMTGQKATITTGVKRYFYDNGTVSLFGNGALGLASGGDNATAAFTGGGGVKLALEKASRKFPLLKLLGGSHVMGAVDVVQINGVGVSPTFSFGIGVDFR